MNPGNIPRTRAICKNGLRKAKRKRESVYDMIIVINVESVAEITATIKVLIIHETKGKLPLLFWKSWI